MSDTFHTCSLRWEQGLDVVLDQSWSCGVSANEHELGLDLDYPEAPGEHVQ